ncbi:MAG: ABC transporter permease [Lachnospiraceae bacterium]|nr:ABC transporter permease [Lachnospiraceae bacterium]
MGKYILKRALYIIPTYIVLTILVYVILSFSPGDPVLASLGANATQEQIAQKTAELGLDKPLPVRYLSYMSGFLQGDMGKSWISGNRISVEFSARIGNTLLLLLYSLILTIVLGTFMGVIAAVKQNSITDNVTMVIAMLMLSIPAFFLGLIMQLIFCMRLKMLPVTGAESFRHFILPSIVLAASRVAGQVRMTRSSMLDVIGQDYIRTARAKGASEVRVICYHALRNGLLPAITNIGNNIGGIVSGAVTVETIFAVPGIGSMLVNAVRTADIPGVMGPLIFIALLVCVVNVLIDLLYAFIDPRVRKQLSK